MNSKRNPKVRLIGSLATISILVGVILGSMLSTGSASAAPLSKEITIGQQPKTMTVDPNGKVAFITYVDSKEIDVVSIVRGEIVHRIRIGQNPTDTALSPDGKLLYVSSDCSSLHCDRSVYVFNAQSFKRVATIAVGGATQLIQVSRDGKSIDVAISDHQSATSYEAFSVFDIATGQRKIRVPIAVFPDELALSSDGTTAYIAANSAASGVHGSIKSELDVVNVQTGAKIADLSQGQLLPCGLVANPNGESVYESFCAGSKNPFGTTIGVRVIQSSTNSVVSIIRIPGGAKGLAISPDGKTLYIAEGLTATVDVARTSDNSIVRTIPVKLGVPRSVFQALATSPDGRSLIAMNFSLSPQGRLTVVGLKAG